MKGKRGEQGRERGGMVLLGQGRGEVVDLDRSRVLQHAPQRYQGMGEDDFNAALVQVVLALPLQARVSLAFNAEGYLSDSRRILPR